MTTTQNDDDLIIIEDDNDIMETYDDKLITELDIKGGEELISFDDEIKSDVPENNILEMEPSEENQDENFDFSGLSEQKEEKQEEKEEESFNFWELDKQKEEENTETNPFKQEGNETMVSILDWTIGKLQSRKENSVKDIKDKNSHVSGIETEISKLQSEKKEIEKDIKVLESENTKIDSNITSLETMKSGEIGNSK
jgi:chromosome segregation ATPase